MWSPKVDTANSSRPTKLQSYDDVNCIRDEVVATMRLRIVFVLSKFKDGAPVRSTFQRYWYNADKVNVTVRKQHKILVNIIITPHILSPDTPT